MEEEYALVGKMFLLMLKFKRFEKKWMEFINSDDKNSWEKLVKQCKEMEKELYKHFNDAYKKWAAGGVEI